MKFVFLFVLLMVITSASEKAATNVVPSSNFIQTSDEGIPIILMHGIVASVVAWEGIVPHFEQEFPNRPLHVIEIGKGVLDSVKMDLLLQIDNFAEQMAALDVPVIDIVAHSQGGIITRSYVQNYANQEPERYPQVRRLITGFTPNSGVSQVPKISFISSKFIHYVMKTWEYAKFFQKRLSFLNYFRDTYNINKFLEKSRLLPDLNNIRNFHECKKLNSLEFALFIANEDDKTVRPWQSGVFSEFIPNSTDIHSIYDEEHPLSRENGDVLGLFELMQENRMRAYKVSGIKHKDFTDDVAIQIYHEYVFPVLRGEGHDLPPSNAFE
ncbi:hypothetical protein PCE1_001988 [Barthelona sp. PCE]